MRVKFREGKQREFLEKVLINTNCPSLRELSKRININYSTLKNYFNESILLPKNLFLLLSEIGKLKLKVSFVENNWGQIIGGKKSRMD